MRFAELGEDDRAQVEQLLASCDLLPAESETEILLVRDGSAVLGCVGIEAHGSQGLLRSLAVNTGSRGRGHGRELVRGAIAALRTRGVEAVWLLTLDAAPLFAELGFEPVDRDRVPVELAGSTEFVADRCRRATCMRLELTS